MFDFGGVLTYSCWDIEVMSEIIANVLRRHNINVDDRFHEEFNRVMEDAWNRVIHTLIEENMADLIAMTLRNIGIEPRQDIINEALDKISDAPFCIVRKDAEKTLKTLKSMDLKIAVVSNALINFHERVLKKENLIQYIDAIVVSCDVKYRKPHPRIYEIALEKLGIRPSEAIFVGDVPEIDIVGAKKLGMICVLMRTPEPYMQGRTMVSGIFSVEPDFIIDELWEVVGIVNHINNKKRI